MIPMTRNLALSVALFMMGAVPSVLAQQIEDFGPYAENETPALADRIPMRTLSRTTVDCLTTVEYGPKDGAPPPLLRIDSLEDKKKGSSLVLQLTRPAPQADMRLEIPGASGGYTVFSLDLNGDGVADYAIPYEIQTTKPTETEEVDEEGDYDGGGSRNHYLLFILSVQKSVSVISVPVSQPYYLNEKYFVKDPAGEGALFLHQTVIRKHGVKPKYEGNSLSFYLYRPLAFGKDGTVKVQEGKDPRFPMFVSHFLSSQRKNHRETKLLDPEGKKALLQKYPLDVVYLKPELKLKQARGKKRKAQ